MKNEIFFVCGALRSGSTLLHLIIDKNPKLSNPGEFDFFFDKITIDGEEPELNYYESWLATHRIFNHKELLFPEAANSYKEVLCDFIDQIEEKDKKLFINIHRNFHLVLNYFPNAKYIHLLRDPRDVARSTIAMGWAGNVYTGVDHWLESEESWDKLEKCIQPENYIELRYEDFVSKPEISLKKLCKFVGVDYDELMLNFHESSTYKPLDSSLILQWKNKLSENQISLIEAKIKMVMKSFPYDYSGLPEIKISNLHHILLKLQDKLYKLKFKFCRYGYSTTLKEIIYRKLRFHTKYKKIRLVMNEVELKHLK